LEKRKHYPSGHPMMRNLRRLGHAMKVGDHASSER
jgi:hypothetical protein